MNSPLNIFQLTSHLYDMSLDHESWQSIICQYMKQRRILALQIIENDSGQKKFGMGLVDANQRLDHLIGDLTWPITDDTFKSEQDIITVGKKKNRRSSLYCIRCAIGSQTLYILQDELTSHTKACSEGKFLSHIIKSSKMRERISMGSQFHQSTSIALSQINLGIVFFNGFRKALYCNTYAKQLFEAHADIALGIRGFRTGIKDQDETINHLLIDCINHSLAHREIEHLITIENTENTVVIPVVLKSVPNCFNTQMTVKDEVTATAFICTPQRYVNLSQHFLKQTFGISKREATVAIGIANGHTTKDIADHHHISIETVRGHLKSIYKKTSTHSQKEVAKLLLSNCANDMLSTGQRITNARSYA